MRLHRIIEKIRMRFGEEKFDFVVAVIAAAALVFMLALCCGCGFTKTTPASTNISKSDRQVIPGHDRSKVSRVDIGMDGNVIITMTELDQLRDKVREMETAAAARSAAVTSTDAKALDMKTDSPRLDFAWGSAEGGAFDLSVESLSSGTNILIVAGALCVVAGAIVGIWLGLGWLGIAIASAGVGLIAVGVSFNRYPWLAPLIALAILAIAGIMVWLHFRKTKKIGDDLRAKDVTARTLVKAVAKSVKNSREHIKEKVEDEAGGDYDVVKDTITDIKREENLRHERRDV